MIDSHPVEPTNELVGIPYFERMSPACEMEVVVGVNDRAINPSTWSTWVGTIDDDIVEGVMRCCDKPATANPDFDPLNPDPSTAAAPHRVFNIGKSQPVELMRFIEVIEQALAKKAIKQFLPIQPGDVVSTASDTNALARWVGFNPSTPLTFGVEKFVHWYADFYSS